MVEEPGGAKLACAGVEVIESDGFEIPLLTGRIERVRWIRDRMCFPDGWPKDHGRFAAAVARAWGCSEGAIRSYSTSAHDYLRMVGEKDSVLKMATVRLLDIADEQDKDRVPALATLLRAVGAFSSEGKNTEPLRSDEVRARFIAMVSEPTPATIEALREAFARASDELIAIMKEALDARMEEG